MDKAVEDRTKEIKRDVEGWREIILLVESALSWQRPADPGIVFGGTSIIFLLFWYLDPSFLTTVALVGLLLATGDYFAPMIQSKLFGQSYWNSKREKKLDEICKTLAVTSMSIQQHLGCFFGMRTSAPTWFFAIVFPTLATLICIGNSVNNVLLTYILVVAILLIPGLNSKGLLTPVKNIMASMCCKSKETKKID